MPNSLSIAVVPSSMTGLSWCRQTSFVTAVPLWPTRREMSSILTPLSESSDAKLFRSSRGVQSAASSPAFATTFRNAAFAREAWFDKAAFAGGAWFNVAAFDTAACAHRARVWPALPNRISRVHHGRSDGPLGCQTLCQALGNRCGCGWFPFQASSLRRLYSAERRRIEAA
jgi:hypothetical protein